MSTLDRGEVQPVSGDIEKIFHISLDLICVAGVDGYFKKINPAFTRVLGYSEKELLETPFIEFIHPDDRERTMKEVEAQLQGSTTLHFENRYLHKGGSIRWLSWNAHAAAEEGLLYAIARDVTNQKRHEENLSFEMRELREIVESNTDIFYIYNVEGKLIKWNRAMENLTGLMPQELMLKPALKCIFEEDWPLASQTIREVFDKGFGSVEARFVGADGTPVPYLFNGYLLKDVDGTVTGFAGTGRDVTALKRTEAALRESEGRYRELFENASDFVFAIDLAGMFTTVNISLCGRSGYRADELIGSPISKLVSPADLEKGRKMTEAKLKGEASHTRYELGIIAKNGEIITIELNSRLIIEGGKPVGVQGIGRDISERRKAEIERAEQLNFIEQLINAIPNPVFYKDVQGRYLGCNKAFERYIGRPCAEMVGKSVYEISPRELADRYYAADKALFDKPGVQTYEAKVQSSAGELRDVLFNKATFNKSSGSCGGLIGVITDITELKRAEAARRESEERFRALIETADDAIILTDTQFNRIYENEASWISLGYTREEWEQLGSSRERIHSDDIATAMEKQVELLNKGTVISKYRVRHKDGRYLTRLAKSKVVHSDGKPTAVISILRDITDMEQASEPLRQSELLMTVAQQMAHIGGWEYDVEKQSMIWTDEVYRIHDISPEDIPPGSIDHIARSVACYDPADRPVFQAAFRKCVEQGVPYDMEFPFTSAKGHRMFIRTAGYPVFAKGKKAGIAGAVGHIMDITERKEADNVFKAIVEATSSVVGEKFFRSLVQHLAQAMYMRYAFVTEMDDANTARTIAFWADGKIGDNFSYDIRRTPCENVVGKELRVYPENVATLFPEDRWLKDNGIKSYMAIPLLNSAGKCFGHMGIMDDKPIFDVNRHVDVLNIFAVRAANELERKEAEEKLKTAKEAAEAATLLKDKFVSLVAHDLRSPLATISMMLNVTMTGLKKARHNESVEMLAKVNSMCQTMMEMTVNLLDAAKLQAGDIRLNRKMCGIKNVCDAVIGDLGYLAEKKGIQLKNEAPDDARFYVDKVLFQRVIHNLVTNAVKFSNKGGTVTIFLPGGNNKQLAVKDAGTGIHESLLPDIFKYEVKTTTTGTSGERGTGFGLPMSMDIMKAHGGTIRATSRPGEGSTFFVEVPDMKPLVLVVDDDEAVVFILRKYLEKMGAGVLTAKNGNEALAIVQSREPVLVITDLAMPETDGFVLLQDLKNSAKYSHIPVIIITGNRSIGIRQSAFELRADDFITKPLSEPDFIPRIGRFIAG